MSTRLTRCLMVGFLFAGCPVLFAQGPSTSGYHMVQEVVLGGEGGWDYLKLDAGAGRLYISRATQVLVVDPDSGKPLGTIADTPGVHGIAVATALGTGYTSNGRDGTVTVFDLHSLRPLARLTVGSNPDAIVYEPVTKQVFTFNGASHDASVIDAERRAVTRTLPLDGKPEFAVADGRGAVYVNIEDKAELLKIGAGAPAIEARWSLAPCENPTGLSMDTQHRRLFVGCANRLMAVVDADKGDVLATLPIGDLCDATAFDPEHNLAFSSNGDGTLTIVREEAPNRFVVVDNVATKRGARTMALDATRQRVYLVTAAFGPRPAATANDPHPRVPIVPGTFRLLVLARGGAS